MVQWLKLGLTGLAILVGLFVASSAQEGFWHYFGLLFALLSALLLFRLIGRAFDPPSRRSDLLPTPARPSTRMVLGGVLALAGIVMLFVASGAHGGGAYYLPLFAAVLAFVYIFRLIAASFDHR